jgi:hypothetical protein
MANYDDATRELGEKYVQGCTHDLKLRAGLCKPCLKALRVGVRQLCPHGKTCARRCESRAEYVAKLASGRAAETALGLRFREVRELSSQPSPVDVSVLLVVDPRASKWLDGYAAALVAFPVVTVVASVGLRFLV